MSSTIKPPIAEEQEKNAFITLRPILVYDGNCDFCRFWVDRWRRMAYTEVDFEPYQQLPAHFHGISRDQFAQSVYLITQYRRLKGAAAVFEVLAIGGNDFWNRLYYNVVLADTVFEAGYRFVASNRDFFFRLTKLFYDSARQYDSAGTKQR